MDTERNPFPFLETFNPFPVRGFDFLEFGQISIELCDSVFIFSRNVFGIHGQNCPVDDCTDFSWIERIIIGIEISLKIAQKCFIGIAHFRIHDLVGMGGFGGYA